MRMLLHLGRLPEGELSNARVIAKETGIPSPYASKLLSRLSAARLVLGLRGKRGGVRLACDPAEITLLDVMNAIGSDEIVHDCVLGFSACDDEQPCPLHPIWKDMRQQLLDAMLHRSLEDLLKVPISRIKKRGTAGKAAARTRRTTRPAAVASRKKSPARTSRKR